jgi:hypothetical protein
MSMRHRYKDFLPLPYIPLYYVRLITEVEVESSWLFFVIATVGKKINYPCPMLYRVAT